LGLSPEKQASGPLDVKRHVSAIIRAKLCLSSAFYDTGTFSAGPEQADLLANSRSVPKGPDDSALALKKAAINVAIIYIN